MWQLHIMLNDSVRMISVVGIDLTHRLSNESSFCSFRATLVLYHYYDCLWKFFKNYGTMFCRYHLRVSQNHLFYGPCINKKITRVTVEFVRQNAKPKQTYYKTKQNKNKNKQTHKQQQQQQQQQKNVGSGREVGVWVGDFLFKICFADYDLEIDERSTFILKWLIVFCEVSV